MFRVSQFMQELAHPTPLGRKRRPPAPVVIWNLVRRCNLACKHCYTTSADRNFPGELDTADILDVMDDLKAFGVPALILSGGEPLLRPGIFEITAHAKELGFYVALSSNGTLIDQTNIDRIAAANYDYVGISIDGIKDTHDTFRRKAGAFDRALNGVRLCKSNGIKVGLRFTVTQDNAHELERMMQLLDDEEIDKFYLSHLNYGGRGNRNRKTDAALQTTREVMDHLFEVCWTDTTNGHKREFVTGNNDADGVYLLHWIARRFPERLGHMRAKLAQWGGNASGIDIANIDNLGNVHPDTFWWHYTLGNVRERPFSAIWSDHGDPLMAGLNSRPRPLKGRCAECAYLDICGGNTRVRAHQMTGDAWAEDPGCYLYDEEIAIGADERAPATVTG